VRRTHVLVLAIAVGLAAIITLRWREARRDSPPAVEEPPDTMDEARFWSVIEPLKSLAVDEREPSLAAVLVELPPEDVQMFAAEYQKVMNRAYTWDLWGAGYVVMQGCSDDGFKEFRNWLISEGRDVYEAVLREPDRLAELARIPVSPEPELGDWPMLGQLDLIALDLLGGFDSPNPVDTTRLHEITDGFEASPHEPSGEPFEEDPAVLSARYPRLWKIYGPGGSRERGR